MKIKKQRKDDGRMQQFFTTLYRSVRAKPVVCLFILVSQIVSVLCIFFVIGLVHNSYYYFQDADEEDRTLFAFIFNTTDPYDLDPELRKFFYTHMLFMTEAQFSQQTEEAIADEIKWQNEYLDSLSEDERNEVLEMNERYAKAEKEAKLIDIEKLNNGYTIRDFAARYDEIFGDCRDIIQKVSIQCYCVTDDGEDFYWTGSTFYEGLDEINYSSNYFIDNIKKTFSPDYPMEAFEITFSRPLTYKQQQSLVNKFYKEFDAIEVDQPEADLLEQQMSRSQQFMSAALIAIVVANCSLCYAYIFSSRRKMFAIMRICGAEKDHCFIMCMAEVLLYMAVSFSAAFAMFDRWLKNTVIKFYPLAEPAYTTEAYLRLLGIYVLVTIAIMGACAYINVGRPIKEETKERR